jgi:hypothetical protein
LIARLQDEGARAIPKKDASIPILPIRETGERFGSYDKSILNRTGSNCLRSHIYGINESRARRGDVERAGARRSNFILNNTRSRREDVLRSRRGDNDEIDVFSVDVR